MSTFHEAVEQLDAMLREEAQRKRGERRATRELLFLLERQRSPEACRSLPRPRLVEARLVEVPRETP